MAEWFRLKPNWRLSLSKWRTNLLNTYLPYKHLKVGGVELTEFLKTLFLILFTQYRVLLTNERSNSRFCQGWHNELISGSETVKNIKSDGYLHIKILKENNITSWIFATGLFFEKLIKWLQLGPIRHFDDKFWPVK